MPKKVISTCIDEKLRKEALINDISWARALELGVEILLSGKMELQKLQEEKTSIEAKLEHIAGKIEGFKKAEKEKGKQNKIVLKNLEELKKGAEIIGENIRFLRGRTNSWNRHTGMRLKPDDFYKLCKRFEQGEFKNNSGGKP